MMRRRLLPALALPSLVGLSTLLHWLAGRRIHGLWIVPDEPIYASRALAAWHHGPLGLLHGHDAGYSVLYPIVAGIPLSVGSTVTGYASLKLLQALVVSLAAVPVFAYGRRLMPPPYALVAATLTVASPLLLYSGLVMTEVLFYPLAALTLLAIARAVATATTRDQAIALVLVVAAVLTRTQAVVFVAVFGLAVAVDTALARDRTRLRLFWPVWLLLALGAIVVAVRPGVVGAYAVTLRGGYPIGSAVKLTLEHLSYAALSTGVVPLAALLMLAVAAIRRREPDVAARAFVAVALSAIAVVVVQVGVFAARYSPHLLGRDLAALPPLLFLALALWISRGAPRPRVTVALVAFGVLCLILLAPWNSLVDSAAFADTFDLTLFTRIHAASIDVVTVFALLALMAFALMPRVALMVLPLLVLCVLVSASGIAAKDIAAAANERQVSVVGPDPNWIDDNAHGNVTYLYGGERNWSTVWQERFWNRRLDRVLSIAPSRVPGPLVQTVIGIAPDGRLPTNDRYVVAPDRFSLVGAPVAHLAQTGLDVSGLTLWDLHGAPRVDLIEGGIQPNGDMTRPATISVYDCGHGRLEVTLLPKATDVVRILLDRKEVLSKRIAGLSSWRAHVTVPPSATPRLCTFTIVPKLLLGSTRIAFVRF
jgi:hypothetical protein